MGCRALVAPAILAASLIPASALAQSANVLFDFVDIAGGVNSGVHPYSGLVADKSGNFYGTTENGGTYGFGTVFELSPPLKSAGKNAPWIETTLYNFSDYGDGGVPATSLVFDKSGNLYGTTSQGGDPNALDGEFLGTVFKLSPAATPGTSWTETTLYAFTGLTDGGDPLGGVIFDRKGNLYGTASEGGDDTCGAAPSPIGAPVGCGVVYELSPPAGAGNSPWTESILWTFEGENAATPDGQTPSGNLVFDKKRQYLFGTTQSGGAVGFGMVYKLRPRTKKVGASELDIYDFQGGNLTSGNGDGETPISGVIVNKAGDLFGTAYGGGANNLGMVFELTPGGYQNQWDESDIFDFTAANGGGPVGNVTFHGQSLIGATAGSGKTTGKYGTVYVLTPDSTGTYAETVLYSFAGGTTGSFPTGKLVVRKGAIYGTSLYGGQDATKALGWGTVYRILP